MRKSFTVARSLNCNPCNGIGNITFLRGGSIIQWRADAKHQGIWSLLRQDLSMGNIWSLDECSPEALSPPPPSSAFQQGIQKWLTTNPLESRLEGIHRSKVCHLNIRVPSGIFDQVKLSSQSMPQRLMKKITNYFIDVQTLDSTTTWFGQRYHWCGPRLERWPTLCTSRSLSRDFR